MSTEMAQSLDAPVQASLYTLLAPFTGYRYRFLLALLKNPEAHTTDICRDLGITEQQAYNWRYLVPGFKTAMDAIREGRADLRTEYAKLAFLEATPKVADAMVERAQGSGPAAQRAGERILETTGVLQPASTPSNAPITLNVVYYTNEGGQRKVVQGQTIEVQAGGQVKAIEPPKAS